MHDLAARLVAALDGLGLSDAEAARRLRELATQAGLGAVPGIGRESVRSWRSGALPNALALSLVARLVGRPMRWLVDGREEAEGGNVAGLSEDERFVLRTWRAQRIDADEAARRLARGD